MLVDFICQVRVHHFAQIHTALFVLFVSNSITVNGQIFPGLSGDELVEALQEEYTPTVLLNDNEVRDTLYARVFFQDDSVKCIYSGLPRFLPQEVDPSQYLFGNGNDIGSINLEHGWPQAKGAGDGTRGNIDMHHLYPARVKINSDRANFPYQDIDDDLTQNWYYLDIEMSMKPMNNIGAYSEFSTGYFEPREEVKGDIARAMFYFWTIYREDAMDADPSFFDLQKEYLCEWVLDDPADEFEILRNERISEYQGGKINPFIVDCSLTKRTYCPDQMECSSVPVQEPARPLDIIEFDSYDKRFRVNSNDEREWAISVFNPLGQLLFSDQRPSNSWTIPGIGLTGYCIVFAQSGELRTYRKFFWK